MIIREQGGSVMTIGSGDVLRAESGASVHVNDGASLIIKDGATTHQEAVALFNAGPNQFWYALSSTCPTFSASPGDVLWLSQSSATSFWVNVSDGAAGSVWRGIGGLGSHVSFVK